MLLISIIPSVRCDALLRNFILHVHAYDEGPACDRAHVLLRCVHAHANVSRLWGRHARERGHRACGCAREIWLCGCVNEHALH